jgi:hypothetical protein
MVSQNLRTTTPARASCVGSLPVLGGTQTFEAFDKHATVPGAVVDGEMAPPGQVSPESPEIGPGAFFVCGCGDRYDVVEASVERLGDPPDAAALPGRIRAFEDHDDRALVGLQVARQAANRKLELLDPSPVLGLGDRS